MKVANESSLCVPVLGVASGHGVRLAGCGGALGYPVFCSADRSGRLTICLRLGPPWFSCWFSFTLAYSGISQQCSSLFVVVNNLIFIFSI